MNGFLQSLADNPSMTGLVHELIVPSVKSKEPLIREQGLMCLGLCCLLDKVSRPKPAHHAKQ